MRAPRSANSKIARRGRATRQPSVGSSCRGDTTQCCCHLVPEFVLGLFGCQQHCIEVPRGEASRAVVVRSIACSTKGNEREVRSMRWSMRSVCVAALWPTAVTAFRGFFSEMRGASQLELVRQLQIEGVGRTPKVQKILEEVDRKHFVPQNPYADAPQTLGYGATISAPHMHAIVLEEMLPFLCDDDCKVLDVGCGSGYLTACLARLAKNVCAIDIIPELVALTNDNLRKDNLDLLDRIHTEVADGWEGLPSEAPFVAIHVGAAADGLPVRLALQLAVGGVLLVPVGKQGETQTLYKLVRQKEADTFSVEDFECTPLLQVRYVPLVAAQPRP